MAAGKQKKSSRREKGSTMLEGLFTICFLMFVFLAMLQVFQWVTRQMISDYASFYGAKALSLGYAAENCRKAVRVAAMGMSGRDMSDKSIRIPLQTDNSRYLLQEQAARYMSMGMGSGIDFEYWDTHRNSDAYLSISLSPFQSTVSGKLRLKNAPLLVPAMGKVLNLSSSNKNNPDAASENRMYNYAGDFLKR